MKWSRSPLLFRKEHSLSRKRSHTRGGTHARTLSGEVQKDPFTRDLSQTKGTREAGGTCCLEKEGRLAIALERLKLSEIMRYALKYTGRKTCYRVGAFE